MNSFSFTNPVVVVPGGTNIITQAGLDDAGVNLNLSIEDAGEIANGAAAGTRSGKEGPVEDFDLSFELASPRAGEGERDHIILDLLRGRGVSEEELIREIRDLLDDLFQRNVLLAGREETDAQAVIVEGLGLCSERQVRSVLTERHPVLAGGARGRNERQRKNPSRAR